MTYFDNGATTYPKPKSVISSVNYCIKRIGGNPSRSTHKLSMLASEEVYKTRECIAKMLNVSTPENIVFTYNATYALNLAIKTLVREKCHIIISDVEHNSVLRPLEYLKKQLKIEYDKFDSDESLDKAIPKLIRPDTRFIISTLASNVSGKEIDYNSLSMLAKKHSLKLIVDASQILGHKTIDLKKYECDALCAPGHKALFGIQGSGFACFKSNIREGDFVEGGSGSDSFNTEMPIYLPEGYEAGTLGTVGIVALRSGIEFVTDIGYDNIEHHLNKIRMFIEHEISRNPAVIIYPSYGGNLIFNLKERTSMESALILDQNNICTRGGYHCAPLAHEKLGTSNTGVVRASFSIMNTMREAEEFVLTINKITKNN